MSSQHNAVPKLELPHRRRAPVRRTWPNLAATAVIGLIAPSGVVGQQLIDLNPNGSASPSDFTALGSQLFFVAGDDIHGRELWSTDGTAANTALVKDIHPGPADSNISEPTVFNGRVFFRAEDGTNGSELWVSDGTETGTKIVQDIHALASSNPTGLAAFNGQLYFFADDGTNGFELWVTDGTGPGTQLFADINPGPASSLPRRGFCRSGSRCPVYDPVVYNGALFFAADDGQSGTELWVTHGALGTHQVLDIAPGVGSSSPSDLTVYNGALYFAADDGASGRELWQMYASGFPLAIAEQSFDINVGASSSRPYGLTVCNSRLFFGANDGANGYEVWTCDGTAAGTALVADVQPGSASSYPSGLTASGTRLFFSADDGANGYELWATDSIALSTRLVSDINPTVTYTPGSGVSTGFTGVTAFQGKLFFTAHDGTNGVEPWLSDGTAAGTRMIDIETNPPPWTVSQVVDRPMIAFNNRLFFAADDGTNGMELWVLDKGEIAACTFRNGSGVNPGDYSCATEPVLGGSWISDVETTSTTLSTLLGIAASPDPATPLFGGELLISLASPTLFVPGNGRYTINIPSTSSLLSATLATQGFRIDTVSRQPRLVLLNAQDLRLGR
ncbi:MAG: ELWxxDGT repeat protein [Planctomycetota bacterium]